MFCILIINQKSGEGNKACDAVFMCLFYIDIMIVFGYYPSNIRM